MERNRGLKYLLGIMIILFLISCKKEPIDGDPKSEPQNIKVGFIHEDLILAENANNQLVKLQFDQKADIEGFVELAIEIEGGAIVHTDPEIANHKLYLKVNAGDTNVGFTISSIDNDYIDEERMIRFNIEQSSHFITPNINSELLIHVVDDEQPSAIGFLSNIGSIREDDVDGRDLFIFLSHPSPTDGEIVVDILYDREFDDILTAYPHPMNGQIKLNINKGDSTTSFLIKPINDSSLNGDQEVVFMISEQSTGFYLGEHRSIQLTIGEDDY